MTISTGEREFFVALGERMASMRKARNLTQVQFAEALGVSQQTVQAYEVGRRRIPVSALPIVARLFDVSLEELFGEGNRSRGKRGPTSRLEQQMEAISQLPKTQQRFVTQMLDTVLTQAKQ
ncbi:helix-turn-helix transcriptional regulator [Noviherbaspirillum album]|nr:helix-turn-helix transcriptional regulator [Noviherbaspirillum sp. CPCC 100848]